MKFLGVFLLCCGLVFGFELVLNVGKDSDMPFAVLHLNNDRNFSCKREFNETKEYFSCIIDGAVHSELKDREFEFFSLKFDRKDQSTLIQINPKIPAKMYNLSQAIYQDENIYSTSLENNSTSYTFIFSQEVPYIKSFDGLNFDVNFSAASLPFVGALDLDSNPVVIPQSADINTFLHIKQAYDNENYTQVLTDTQNAISRYAGSIFMNEFELYRLRAKNELYTKTPDFRNQSELEKMIEEARAWSRTYTSDRNAAEVLYITMRAYMALEQKTNVDYIIDILSNEHGRNFYAQLALLDYADYLTGLGDKNNAQILYNDIYYRTQDFNLAARAALNLAKLAHLSGDKNKALELIQAVQNSNPNAFSSNESISLDLAKMLYNDKEFSHSARIYEAIFTNIDRSNPKYEEILRNLALAQSKTNAYEKAEQYLNSYIEEFPQSEHLALMNEARDGIFFYLGENNASLLHSRYKELMSQYANEIAAKALLYDVRLYKNEQNDDAIIAYKDDIEKYDNAELKLILENAALNRLNLSLRQDNCTEATELYGQFASYEVGQKVSDKKAMLACLKRTLNFTEARSFITQNQAEDPIYYNLALTDLDLGAKNYREAIRISNEILNSRTLKSEEERFEANYIKFLAQLRMDEYNDAMHTLRALQEFPMNYKMVEAYYEFLLYCNERKLTTNILTYAPIAIDFQNLKGVNVYSPELEFIYLDTLIAQKNNAEALAVLKDLLKINLSAENRARALYLQSGIYESEQNEALQRTSLQNCLDINASSNWQNLCRDKASLLGM